MSWIEPVACLLLLQLHNENITTKQNVCTFFTLLNGNYRTYFGWQYPVFLKHSIKNAKFCMGSKIIDISVTLHENSKVFLEIVYRSRFKYSANANE